MKKVIFFIGIAIFTISCEKDLVTKDIDNDPSIKEISGTWIVVSYEDFEKNSVTKKTDVDSWNGLDVILTFTTDSLYGTNTTNSVSGIYTLSERTIHVISYGGTKVGQPEWGNMFSDCIHILESYRINNNQLRFYYNSGKNSVTFNRQ